MKIQKLTEIETPRLLIRPVQLGDEVGLNQAIHCSLVNLQRWMPWSGDPSLAATTDFVKRGVASWSMETQDDFPMVVIHKADQQIVAASGFSEWSVPIKPYYDIGYWIDARYQGRGLVTEFVNALTRYALLALGAIRVQIRTQVENERSQAVAKRCGFIREATVKNMMLDCVSHLPADGVVFANYQVSSLPPLAVTWQHDSQRQSLALSAPVSESSSPVELPMLTTKRLKLIPPRIADAAQHHKALMLSLPEISPYFPWAHAGLTVEQDRKHLSAASVAATDLYAHKNVFYLVWDKAQQHLFGEVWFKVVYGSKPPYFNINYWFDTQHRGCGYAFEAVGELIRYVFMALRARRVEVVISKQNHRSLSLAQRLGFAFEGDLGCHSRNFVSNEVADSALFAMTDLNQLNTDLQAD